MYIGHRLINHLESVLLVCVTIYTNVISVVSCACTVVLRGPRLNSFLFCNMLLLFITAVGMYGDKKAYLFDMVVANTILGGIIMEMRKESKDSNKAHQSEYSQRMQKWFKFLQRVDGSVPAIYHSKEEEPEIANIKKAIASCFQANFEGTAIREEADPQSVHKAEYT